MQPLIFFALFGALLAAIAGIITTATDSTRQFVTNQITETRTYFEKVRLILTENVTPALMQIPYLTCPDGISYTENDVRAYLCQPNIARLTQWVGSGYGIIDPWKREFTGFVIRDETPIYASAPDYVVTVPVTAFALVSRGPDGELATQLEADLGALSSSSSSRDVLRLSAPDPATCDVATDGSCDDIVLTFSNQVAQQRRWEAVKASVDRIGSAALRNYEQQFMKFAAELPVIFANNLSQFVDADGNIVFTSQNVNIWQGQGLNPPTLGAVDLSSATTRTAAGVDEEFRYLTDPISSGGSGLALAFAVTSSANGYQDVLTISVTNSASPWGLWESQGGLLTYRKVVEATEE